MNNNEPTFASNAFDGLRDYYAIMLNEAGKAAHRKAKEKGVSIVTGDMVMAAWAEMTRPPRAWCDRCGSHVPDEVYRI